MTAFARPGVVTAILVCAAAGLHPANRIGDWLSARGEAPGRTELLRWLLEKGPDVALAALLLLVVAALVAQARATTGSRRLGAWLLAAGAVLVVGGVGGDGVLGHRGTLELVPGQTRTHFDEVGVEGRALGLRPFGFTVALDSMRPGGGVALAWSGASDLAVLTPERALGHGGYRFGSGRTVPTGAAARLQIGISGGGDDVIVDLATGRPAQAGDLRLALEEYYPDFALDDQKRPFTRSLEPRNPGALLAVESPRGTFRAFVLRAMPGVHRIEEIGRSFALIAVDPETKVEIDVHREPLAGMALLGALVALVAVILEGRTQ
jgi:hypothetical protein